MSTRPAADVRRVRQADVYVAGVLAANLTRTDDGVRFAYRPEHLTVPGRSVATTLPIADQPVYTAASRR
ncbi:MAG: HipA N-terminal domain-containing protein [Angustibacter sp.]